MQLKNPQLQVVIDRDKMATMGITAQGVSPRQVEEAFWNAYATRQISTINTPNNQYQVILELEDKQWVIGTCGFFPYVRVIGNKMGNVPDRYAWVTRARTPGAALPPTYYLKS